MATRQTSVNVSLSDAVWEWVEKRAAEGGHGTVSEYFLALVREDQKREAREELDRKLVEALDSGEATEMTAADWQHVRSKAGEKLAARNPGVVIRHRPRALCSIIELTECIGANRPAAAEPFFDSLEATLSRLEASPNLGYLLESKEP